MGRIPYTSGELDQAQRNGFLISQSLLGFPLNY